MKDLQKIFTLVQRSASGTCWSNAVELTRSGQIFQTMASDSEYAFRIMAKGSLVSATVSIWPEDESWICDCGEREDPCRHVAAALIALKSGKLKEPEATSIVPQIFYHFRRFDGALRMERHLHTNAGANQITTSLTNLMGGIKSGRINMPEFVANQNDYHVDQVMGQRSEAVLQQAELRRVFKALHGEERVLLDGAPVKLVDRAQRAVVMVTRTQAGYLLQLKAGPGFSETFRNGVARENDSLYIIEIPNLTREEQALFAGGGTEFNGKEAVKLFSEILPALEGKLEITRVGDGFPDIVKASPRVTFQLEQPGDGVLWGLARIVYGSPPIAELRDSHMEVFDMRRIPVREIAVEADLVRNLRWKLNMQTGQAIQLRADEAVRFMRKLKEWENSGEDIEAFEVKGTLDPDLRVSDGRLEPRFVFKKGSQEQSADFGRVMEAWQQGATYVSLDSGGWAELPHDWLKKYGSTLMELIEAQRTLPAPLARIAVNDFLEDCGVPSPADLRVFIDSLRNIERLPEAQLPADLVAELRDYQLAGVKWLQFLTSHGLGAMLADDMGLGKTLQALCAIDGRTLVICPTSVLSAWETQARKFRPGLRLNIYHGPGRTLSEDADLTITSYNILRIDLAPISTFGWDMIVLDEAQNIRNPASLAARAVFQLNARARIALSGTPVENRLADLWSQFNFLSPGLLHTHDEFETKFGRPIAKGDVHAAELLRKRVRPFIMRRLKKEVAPELPDRTETVLHCDLSDHELDTYKALLSATRKEVLEQVNQGQGILGLLELLLRLRQACCHPALLPGGTARNSSKVELLMQTLENSLALGHRALIFSQWTSLLDLLEPQLEEAGISFSRLDGSTPNRESIVRTFQSETGPQVMLLSLKAGGVGITLTAADHVFIMDPWWNPAAESQAADRAHRIGQLNPVFIYRLVARDTIEDKVLKLQARKRELAQSILDDGGSAVALTREDLLQLLED